ncbi:hypothetical protein [Euzebya sp.]|uniref:hypothetical protein n=1 Tax=Euzebya sp. TaxID=1971409 RepID=UPI003519B369
MSHPSGPVALRLSPEELDGDLPMVCAVTGRPAEALTPVWFAQTTWWAWAPLAGLAAWGLLSGRWAPLVSLWGVGALLVPVLTSRGVTGRLPLDHTTRARLANLRTRRSTVVIAALLLTWVAVGLWLVRARFAGFVLLVVVLAMYATAVAMAVWGRTLTVRGRPLPDGGVALRAVHPDFADAVELHRTGHRP